MAAQRPGCQGACWSAADVERHPADPADRPGRLDRVGPGRRAPLAPPAVELAAPRSAPRRPAAAGRAGRPPGRPARPPWARGPPARIGADAAAPGRGRKTWPISNSAVSAKPRPTFRVSTRNSPGSRVVRSSGSSSLSGFATATAGRRMSSGGSPSRSASDRGPNGDDSTSTKPGLGQRPAGRAAQPLPRR